MDEKFTYLGTIPLYELAEALVECSQKELGQQNKKWI